MFFPPLSPELPAFDSARNADLDLHAVRVLEKDGGQFARLVAVLAQDDGASLGVALYGLLDIIGNKSVMVHALFVFRLHKLNGSRSVDLDKAEAVSGRSFSDFCRNAVEKFAIEFCRFVQVFTADSNVFQPISHFHLRPACSHLPFLPTSHPAADCSIGDLLKLCKIGGARQLEWTVAGKKPKNYS